MEFLGSILIKFGFLSIIYLSWILPILSLITISLLDTAAVVSLLPIRLSIIIKPIPITTLLF